MAQTIVQPSFARGEISPGLQARVDLAAYGTGVALAENFIVLADGGMQTRPGWGFLDFIKDPTQHTRNLRFVVSETVAYVVELGHLYARFWFNGSLVKVGGIPVEVVTPWPSAALSESIADAAVWRVRYTQSVDVMYLAHDDYPPQRIIRTAADAFSIEPYNFKEGPFRATNTNEAYLLAASAKTGTITLTSNFDLFTATMVGSLVKLEAKALGNIKPWVQGERDAPIGTLRRSEGKVYKLTAYTAGGSYHETGSVRPTHDRGREWDGAGDQRSSGGFNWTVGVEWEYQHSGFGIAQITAFTDARTVTAQVKIPFPDDVIGGLGGAVNTWNLVGNGGVSYSVAGATSGTQDNYTVTLDGVPI